MFYGFLQGYKHKDAFIATQMPLPTTVLDLWTLIYDHKCKTMVMMNPLDPLDQVSYSVEHQNYFYHNGIRSKFVLKIKDHSH